MMRTLIIFMSLILFPSLMVLGQDDSEPTPFNFGFDLGASILIFAHLDFDDNYNDAAYSPDLRGAFNLTYGKLRLEQGFSSRSLGMGDPAISSYGGKNLNNASGKIQVNQSETLLLFVKYEENRVAFIGGGPVTISFDETLKLNYTDNSSESVSGSKTGSGFKLMVGARDKDSILKTTFSYTAAWVTGLSGKSFNVGGYALTFHLSFGTP